MQGMRPFRFLILALLSALLLSVCWPPLPAWYLVFIGFVPLFHLEQYFHAARSVPSLWSYWAYVYGAMLCWNVLTTWWIWNAAGPGSIPAFTLNALLMTIPWVLFYITKKKLGLYYGYVSLITYWISFEYLHMRWELTWPWLTLGNVFAGIPQLIQWYEYTGHLGGSCWVLGVNILFYRGYTALTSSNEINWLSLVKAFWMPIALVAVLAISSAITYHTYQEQGVAVNVTVVQPNVEPYVMKFDPDTYDEQWQRLLSLSKKGSRDATRFIVWPETSIPGRIWMHRIHESDAIRRISDLLRRHFPGATLIAGTDAYQLYENKATPTARLFFDGACCYDAFNSAVQIDTSGLREVYHKSKLVPGVERMPYPQLFGFLERFAIDLGGTSGSLGTQDEREVLATPDQLKIGVAICYESVFGEYVTEYIHKGAQAIFIITNDGWWGNTAGHKQHLVYATLRAIETRKSIARSANTGVSCFINQRGDIQQATAYEEMAVINQDIYFNEVTTFYVRYGDLIGRIALLLTLYFLALPIIKKYRTLVGTLPS